MSDSVTGRAVLRVKSLTVMYGAVRGIEDVNLDVFAGSVTGLLGPNGAGKTTLLRAALDLVHPTTGSVHILGVDSTDPHARRDVAYLPGDLILPGRLSGWATISRYSASRGPLDSDRVEELARRLDLDLDRPVGQLSKGNRQKIGLVLAFAPRARVLLLDEPTSGLDPLLQREFASLVAEAVRDGSGIVLSSHVLSELEGLADRVAVMRGGSLIAIESIADLRQRATTTIRIQLSSSEQAQRFASTLPQERAQAAVEADSQWVSVHFSGDIDSILKHAASFYVCSMESHFGELDEVLMGFYSDSEQP